MLRLLGIVVGLGCAATAAARDTAPAPAPASVTIAGLRWTSSNLAATRFRNGDAIPEVQDAAAWAAAGRAGRPAWARYGNAATAPDRWGVLYNRAAITDLRGLCPTGFRLPTKRDWSALEAALGGGGKAAQAMKARSGWPAGGAGTNSSGFGALPAGFRTQRGEYFLGRRVAYFWTAELEANGTSIAHMLFDDDRPLFRIEYDVAMGMSVRCVAPS